MSLTLPLLLTTEYGYGPYGDLEKSTGNSANRT